MKFISTHLLSLSYPHMRQHVYIKKIYKVCKSGSWILETIGKKKGMKKCKDIKEFMGQHQNKTILSL